MVELLTLTVRSLVLASLNARLSLHGVIDLDSLRLAHLVVLGVMVERDDPGVRFVVE